MNILKGPLGTSPLQFLFFFFEVVILLFIYFFLN